MWDLARPTDAVAELRGHADAVSGVWFALDDRVVLTRGADGRAGILDLDDPEGAQFLTAATSDRFGLAVSPDGTRLWLSTREGLREVPLDIDAVVDRIGSADTGCLPIGQRITYLGETWQIADEAYARCAGR